MTKMIIKKLQNQLSKLKIYKEIKLKLSKVLYKILDKLVTKSKICYKTTIELQVTCFQLLIKMKVLKDQLHKKLKFQHNKNKKKHKRSFMMMKYMKPNKKSTPTSTMTTLKTLLILVLDLTCHTTAFEFNIQNIYLRKQFIYILVYQF